MKWKTLLLLSVAIVLIASSIMLYTINKPTKTANIIIEIIEPGGLVTSLPHAHVNVTNIVVAVQVNTTPINALGVSLVPPPLAIHSPPLYARLWFVLLIAGIVILGFLEFKKFKL